MDSRTYQDRKEYKRAYSKTEKAKETRKVRHHIRKLDPTYLNKRRESTRKIQETRRERLDSIKIAAGCVDCGYNRYAEALDFDHIDKSQKLFTISHFWYMRWDVVEAEIAKCVVRCSNCHRHKSRMESKGKPKK